MLYLVTQRHKPDACPGRNPEDFKRMVRSFSDESMQESGARLVTGYVDSACMLQPSARDHRMTFVFESESEATILSLFKGMQVELTPIVPWSKAVG